MSTTDTIATTTQAKTKVLKPARKQVKPGQVEKKETPQTGKEYSELVK
jgi:pre-mRNA-splicing factor CWC2